VAVAAAGGVAVASGVVPAAVVPAPLRNLVPNASDDSPDGRPGQSVGGPAGGVNGHSPDIGPSASTSPTATPSNLNGLCHSFQDAAAEDLQAALSAPRFAVLVQLAGGREQVVAYCDRLVEHPTGKPEPSPSPAPAAQGRQ
jgi:hypothetical protein